MALLTIDPYTLNSYLYELQRSGWLLGDENGQSYQMHRVIQEVVKRLLGIEGTIRYNQVKGLVERIVGVLIYNQYKDNPVTRSSWLPIGEYVEKLLGAEIEETTIELQNNLAMIFRAIGQLSTARVLHRRATAQAEQCYPKHHPKLAVRYSNLSVVEQELGNISRSKELMEEAIRIECLHYDADHPTLAVRYNNLADLLHELNDLPQALQYIREAHRIIHHNFLPEHPHCKIIDKRLKSIEYNYNNDY